MGRIGKFCPLFSRDSFDCDGQEEMGRKFVSEKRQRLDEGASLGSWAALYFGQLKEAKNLSLLNSRRLWSL
ncbi:hypothetical protein T02_614 [Trichinella nativa]|uniref:Uncharacterized protein n=2 Tax=Trichinella TaxID=6333 RepID=A0A0V1L5F2_9BILA|nr:hypothetical protein T05_8774 [Trichinella murrelli]KRZ54524.1 hypothetical protein T02_614 [Trichinella nativa]